MRVKAVPLPVAASAGGWNRTHSEGTRGQGTLGDPGLCSTHYCGSLCSVGPGHPHMLAKLLISCYPVEAQLLIIAVLQLFGKLAIIDIDMLQYIIKY